MAGGAGLTRVVADGWTPYWRGGAVTSLPEVYDTPGAGPAAGFWRCALAALGGRARILDLGCGNGAVALLAARTAAARGARWEIHGVDRAAIDPVRSLPARYREAAAAVTFHPGASMARTPFDSGYFCLVTGQFAVEYGDRTLIADEVRRVLRPGGRAAFVIHLQESAVVSGAAAELAHLRETRALFDAARAVAAVSGCGASLPARLAAWNRFGREFLRLERLADGQPDRRPEPRPAATLREVPAALRDALTGAIPEPGDPLDAAGARDCRRALADLDGALRAREGRLAELLAAAPDRAGLERLLRDTASRGLDVLTRADLHDPSGPLVAHAVTLRRPRGREQAAPARLSHSDRDAARRG